MAPQQVLPQKSNVSLEDVVKSLASSMQSLEQQMSQIATSVSKLESQGKLPSQTETNPKHNVCAITLRSGKELKNAPAKLRRGHALEDDAGTEPEAELEVNKHADHEQKEEKQFPPAELIAKLPFPERFSKYPNLVSSVCKIDIVDPVLQETLELHQQDKSIEILIDDVNLNHLEKPNEPKFELKPPLEHLKFSYLGDEPYDSAKIYKDKTQGFYDQEIFRQQFVLG
ncbi:DNA-directed DNA polymerase [Senna tora]|uniref:DNA-directed DNA polymerase n=1 Tax=Senna tora TaxID=362788 RepID=A0A835CJU3_9FABA|nr:DNA-directed DNA polymerase [Senna tora]